MYILIMYCVEVRWGQPCIVVGLKKGRFYWGGSNYLIHYLCLNISIVFEIILWSIYEELSFRHYIMTHKNHKNRFKLCSNIGLYAYEIIDFDNMS